MKRDGFLETFEQLGGTVLSNSCGPCIGQWKRADGVKGKADSIVSSFNRNFPGRNDGINETLSFLASPEVVTAYAITGNLGFDPVNQTLKGADGKEFKFEPPQGEELPAKGFAKGEEGFVAPAASGEGLTVEVPPTSERLQLLQPFPRWDGKDFEKLPLLDQDQGQDDDRSHFSGRSLAQVPRPSGQDQRQHVPGCEQCIFLRARQGHGCVDRRIGSDHRADCPPV